MDSIRYTALNRGDFSGRLSDGNCFEQGEMLSTGVLGANDGFEEIETFAKEVDSKYQTTVHSVKVSYRYRMKGSLG